MNLESMTDEELLALRKKIKQGVDENHNKSLAIKILLNSGYGACSNQYFRWYSDDIAESITMSGQLALRWVERAVNKFFNGLFKTEGEDYVIAADTDSVYIRVDRAVKRAFKEEDPDQDKVASFLENFAKVVKEKAINAGLNDMFEELNVYSKCLDMNLESIGPAVWVAKKRYIMSLISYKGVHYNPPKIKMQGIDAVRSSTPAVCRGWITSTIQLIIDGKEKELKEFVNAKREEFFKLPYHQVAFPRGLNDIDKYHDVHTIYKKGCPPHVRGALLHNKLIKDLKLTNQLPLIKSGDKLRFCWMKLPNPLREDVFACVDELPPEFELEQFIDYSLQFDKSFVDPLQHIIKAAGLTLSDTIDISQFFVSE